MNSGKNPPRKEFESTSELRTTMVDYYRELEEASKNGDPPIAWCSSVGPAELLLAFGFKVYYPENHGAVLGSSRTAMDYIPLANAAGYSPDICSYLTSDIGSYIKGTTPLTKAYGIKQVPRPSVLVYNTNQCRDVQDWFRFYSKEYNVPMVGIHSPKAVYDVKDWNVADVSSQIQDMAEELEKITDQSLDMEKFREVIRLSRETSDLWKKVLYTASQVPSPLTFFDGTIHMGPAVVMRGEQESVDYYRLFLEELEQRIQNSEGAIEGEQFRLYWEGMPIWGRLSTLAKLFLQLRTCIVASTYCNSWIFESLNPDDPFGSMAMAYTELFINRSETAKEEYIRKLVDDFHIDGVIFHNAKTCPNNSNSNYGMPNRLYDDFNIPTLVIDGDLNDLRCYSDEQSKTNIEAFIEQLAQTPTASKQNMGN